MNSEASNYPTEYSEEVARRAAKLAKSELVDWKSLSQEERSQYKRRIRDEDKANRARQ